MILDTEQLLMILCGVVIVSYLFTIVSRFIRIPSVILLLAAGMGVRAVLDRSDMFIHFPPRLTEALGVVGLIMIVLEAGLDLKLSRHKLGMVRDSFFAAIVILLVSTALLTTVLFYWFHAPLVNCIVYAIPLSIMSSSIVIPSIHHLSERKKEFLVYEASFSDILGILLFNYFTAAEVLTGKSFLLFGSNIILSVVLSLILSFLLFVIMSKTLLNIKFFLIFALLILIYAAGKKFHLPSLIIILTFGLMINNWNLMTRPRLLRFLPHQAVQPVIHLLHTVTAESSFLIRTFFFILFGYSINLDFLQVASVWQLGGLMVTVLFLVRLLYLRFFLHTQVFPESFFIPRGLITIVLYYKIPEQFKLSAFDDDILFFVIILTGIFMTAGMLFYKKKPDEVVEEGQFSDRKEIL